MMRWVAGTVLCLLSWGWAPGAGAEDPPACPPGEIAQVHPETGATTCVPFGAFLAGYVHDVARTVYVSVSGADGCLVCGAVALGLNLVVGFAPTVFGWVYAPALWLLSFGLAASVLVGVVRVLGAGGADAGAWRAVALSHVRFVVAIGLLGAVGALAGTTAATPASGVDVGAGSGSAASATWWFEEVSTPLLAVSMHLGSVALAALSVDGVDRGLLEDSRAAAGRFLASFSDEFGEVSEGFDSGLTLAHALHLLGTLGLAQGAGLIADAELYTSLGERLVAMIAGVLVMLLFLVFLVTAGLRLLDPLVRVAVVLSLTPLLVAAWVFAPLRGAAAAAWAVFLYALFFFLLAGVFYGAGFSLLTHTFREAHAAHPAMEQHCAGWAPNYRTLEDPPPTVSGGRGCWCLRQYIETHEGLVHCVLRNGGSARSVAPGDVTVSLGYEKVLLAVLALLLAQSVIALVGPAAESLSRHSAGASVGQAAEGQLRSWAATGASLGAAGASLAWHQTVRGAMRGWSWVTRV